MATRLKIGSRGSKLALTQSRAVGDLLTSQHPDLEVDIEIVQTKGDVTSGPLRQFGGQGVFTKELENGLLDGRVDLAVHSLKDLPTDMHADLFLAAAPQREDVRDVLVTRDGCGLEDLPADACLGTGSLRRRCQLLHLRPDLRCAEIRGNIDTRLAKVGQGEYDGVVLAAAALHRLNWRERISAYLEPEQVLPAVGQAALGLQMRRDSELASRVEAIDHAPTSAAVAAERSFLLRLGGGCHAPIAAWARETEAQFQISGLVGAADGSQLVRQSISGPVSEAADLGTQLADALKDQGAAALLESSAD